MKMLKTVAKPVHHKSTNKNARHLIVITPIPSLHLSPFNINKKHISSIPISASNHPHPTIQSHPSWKSLRSLVFCTWIPPIERTRHDTRMPSSKPWPSWWAKQPVIPCFKTRKGWEMDLCSLEVVESYIYGFVGSVPLRSGANSLISKCGSCRI